MSPTILQIRNLSLVFSKHPKRALDLIDAGVARDHITERSGAGVALRKLNLDVLRGELLVVMGLSGSGKSSLLRCINGLNGRGGAEGTMSGQLSLNLPEGNFELHRLDIKTWRKVRSKFMSMVFQQPNLMPWRTVGENIAFPLEVQGIPPKDIELRVEEQLDAVRLLAWKKRMPHELSGGMQQRIGLARALITDSPILLMDEPFSALDPLIRAQLQDDLLESNQRLQKTILFISHDMDEALRLGQRIAIMQEGEILQLDSARNLICNPQHDAVKQFLEHANPLKSLTAKDLMVGADAYPEFKASELQAVFHDSTLHLAMKKLHSSDQPLRVVNKDHKTLGLLAMQDIISGLVK